MKDEDTIDLSDEDFDAHWDDKFATISAVYSLRPGHVLTQDDFDAIQKFDADYRENEQSVLAAFHCGYTQGLREGGSADIEKMQARLDRRSIELGVEKAMRGIAETRRDEVVGHVRDFIKALDKGYLNCKDDSAFIDALRAVAQSAQADAAPKVQP